VKIIHFIGASKPWLVQFDNKGQPVVGRHTHNLDFLIKYCGGSYLVY
jgi:hypothetical protein